MPEMLRLFRCLGAAIREGDGITETARVVTLHVVTLQRSLTEHARPRELIQAEVEAVGATARLANAGLQAPRMR